MGSFSITLNDGKTIKNLTSDRTYDQASRLLNDLIDMETCKVGCDAVERTDDQVTVFTGGRVFIYSIVQNLTLLNTQIFTHNLCAN